MAHRKPLGTTCHSHCHWSEGRPELGNVLETQAGNRYLIVGVEDTDGPQAFGLLLERIADVPEGATVYPFRWNPRKRKRRKGAR